MRVIKEFVFKLGTKYKFSELPAIVHRFFDETGISGSIMKTLCEQKGIAFSGMKNSRSTQVEKELSALADVVRTNTDMELIRKIAGLER